MARSSPSRLAISIFVLLDNGQACAKSRHLTGLSTFQPLRNVTLSLHHLRCAYCGPSVITLAAIPQSQLLITQPWTAHRLRFKHVEYLSPDEHEPDQSDGFSLIAISGQGHITAEWYPAPILTTHMLLVNATLHCYAHAVPALAGMQHDMCAVAFGGKIK